MSLESLYLYVFSFFFSCGGTWGVRRLALRYSLLDIPNQRSSHSHPTPHGGGLALLLSFYLGTGYLVFSGTIDIPHVLGLSGCGLGIAMVGLGDDLFHLSAAKRFLVHFFCAFLAVTFFISSFTAFLPGGNGMPLIFVRLLLVVGIVWLLNLFNFMDGIDGLAGAEALSVALGAGVLLFCCGETGSYFSLLMILAASVLGFLIWNWPPAKIFMGDACSGFLGFCFGILCLLTISSTGLTLWTWLLLLAAFVVDSTVTLMVRVWRGEKFYQAHRSHAYQILARRMGAHLKVTLCYVAINWLFLFPLACFSVYRPESGLYLVIFSYSLLTILCMVVGAGTTND